jgi:hypothetical protein
MKGFFDTPSNNRNHFSVNVEKGGTTYCLPKTEHKFCLHLFRIRPRNIAEFSFTASAILREIHFH